MARREKRKRDHIPLSELLASALADRLPAAHRDELRAAKVPADNVIRLFTPDHNHLHALGGSDAWWNITMAFRGADLKAKDNRDTGIVAKSDRLVKARLESEARLRAKLIGPSPFVDMPERSRSRWPQGRKIQGGNSFQRRR